jgi:hypothetical protein
MALRKEPARRYASAAVALVQSRRDARESARVAPERDKALEVRGFLMEMFGATGAGQAVGDTVTVRRLLDLQVAQLANAYADRPEMKAEMMEVLADGYDRLGLLRARTSAPRGSGCCAPRTPATGARSRTRGRG